jgi:hypothetical protein
MKTVGGVKDYLKKNAPVCFKDWPFSNILFPIVGGVESQGMPFSSIFL